MCFKVLKFHLFDTLYSSTTVTHKIILTFWKILHLATVDYKLENYGTTLVVFVFI